MDETTPLISSNPAEDASISQVFKSTRTIKPSKSFSWSRGIAPRTKKFLRFLLVPILLLVFIIYKFYNLEIRLTSSSNHSLLGPSLTLRLYTNNIRFDNFRHPDPHEKPWLKRRVESIDSMHFNTGLGHANVICLQEVLHNQLLDIINGLNDRTGVRTESVFESDYKRESHELVEMEEEGNVKDKVKEKEKGEWTYYGVGRTDGVAAGEFAPIIFKSRDFIILENTTFWLSETPHVPSKGWDAALERIVTLVTFQSKINPLIKFNVFNTHYDHRGHEARRKSSQLIVDKMKNYNAYPSFLCGDFNTEPRDEPYHILTNAGFKDSRVTIDKQFAYGHETTFTAFDKNNEPYSIIDYIWSPYFTKLVVSNAKEQEYSDLNSGLNNNGGKNSDKDEFFGNNFFNLDHHQYYSIVIKQFGILGNFFKGFYFSDHRPVVATYELTRTRLF